MDIIERARQELVEQSKLMDSSGGDLAGYISLHRENGYSTALAMATYEADFDRLLYLEDRLTLLLSINK
jgi:hypothetical protein